MEKEAATINQVVEHIATKQGKYLTFSLAEEEYGIGIILLLLKLNGKAETVVIGIVVDSVSEVLNIIEQDIEEAPSFGTQLNTNYIFGMAKTEGGVKILLDIDCVLTSDEISLIEKTA